MKSTIIYLGLVASFFTTNSKAANEFKAQDLNQQEIITAMAENNQQNQLILVSQQFSKGKTETNTAEEIVLEPITKNYAGYSKTVEETIIEDQLITESQQVIAQPLSLEKTFADYINEANQITESNVTTEVYSLDFEKINRSVKNNKVYRNNMAVTVDLKL
ncbi:hypothetical protein EZL74_07065 [Flavobacterium silvisoli]|uniref:Uncharacterized protein n=1 Tax=Flavobacterium silvisoli TaxID=2529433 RepID=A0A4Q9YZ41_9FLAO|nr:hypothetical protein [Flavobacterium silvisoli]TBX69132.1 hypothetical protein EZL74_07065 [Flavobacterium silvisoli]